MYKKMFILLFCLIMLISVSAVSAEDLDDNNETVVASDMEVENLSASNDVNAMDELNEDDTGSDDVLQSDAKSAAACEKEILSVGDSDSDVLGAKGSTINIDDAYYQKIGSDYKIIVTGYVRDADDEDINKGTVSIYLNDESKGYCDAEFGEFNGEVDVGPGSYNVRVRYHDDSGDYLDSQDDYYDNPIIIKPPEPTTWYVNGSKPYGGGGKSEADAFSTLNEALYSASNNDTVKIAAGTYAGSANIGPYIQKILTFEKYGDGEAIFDGQGQGTIWSVGVDTINIYGLTFINGGGNYGGALYFLRDVSNSVINATFRDNSVSICGGAIYVDNSVSNLTLRSTFINNTANDCGAAVYIKSTASNLILNSTFIGNTAGNNGAGVYIGGNADNVKVYGEYRNNAASQGGVIYANKAFSSSVIDATFINNTAKNLGGAFCFNGDLTGVDISGKFLNNPGRDSIIYVANSVSGNSIHDSVFLNNEAYKICTVYNGEITAKDNWFGSNASNYYKIPEDVGIDLENWLFLNATADPSELAADEKSAIIFKLSSFDGSEIIDYDASKMNIVLDLSQTLGQLDKTSAPIGENITYTAKESGNATVTGKFETASYTVSLTNSDPRTPTVLNIYMIYPGEYNPSFTVDIGGRVKNNMTGDTIKKGSVKLYLDGENVKNITVDADDGSISDSFGSLDVGNYTIKVVYHDDTGEFKDCEWNSSFEIKQATTEITINNTSIELIIGNSTIIEAVLSPSGAGNLNYSSNDTSVVVVNENGVVTAVGEGNAYITVAFAGNEKYTAASKNITVNVSLNDASVSVDDDTMDLFIGQEIGIDAYPNPDTLNVTFKSNNESVATVDANGKVTAIGLGNTTITVSVGGDGVYALNSTTVTVNVGKITTEIIVVNTTVDMNVGDNVIVNATLIPDGAGELDFTSSDVSVVTVNGIGTITAVGEGVANVTVRFMGNNKYAAASKNITVTVSLNDASVSVNNSTLNLSVDDTFTIVPTTTPAGLNVTYVVDNSGVVSVADDGVVTALKEGTGNITVKVGGDGVYAENSTTIAVTVSKIPTEIESSAITTVYNVNKNLVITLKDVNGTPLGGANITVDLNGEKTYTTDEKGQVTVSTKGLAPKSYTAKITFNGNSTHDKSTKDVKVTVKKATPKITAKTKTFKTTTKTKKYAIVLKNNVNKAINKATVYLKVGGKTYKATTNSKGKATFKITKLAKKGTYKATITYKGNKYYNKATKKVTIKVKSVWKTVSKGSKNSAIVKKIQRALKNNGYYLEYNGRYLKVDGIYWDYTEMAVKEFQKAKSLKVTGKVDEKTAKKLGII